MAGSSGRARLFVVGLEVLAVSASLSLMYLCSPIRLTYEPTDDLLGYDRLEPRNNSSGGNNSTTELLLNYY